uniref:Vomeronasal type-1 receptor n=1 Tax=Panagrolaimus sp. ES5 TaxID=591445 RepID=A0AC34G9G8_9BILA
MYLLVIPILWQPNFQKESCYKMMAYIAVVDIVAITINGILTGVFAIMGAVFCSFPSLQIFGGMMALSVWVAESDLAVILAFNRCLSMAFPSLCKTIFTQNRTHLWVALSIAHAVIIVICTDTLTFNSLYGVWLVNPHMGYTNHTGREYKNVFHLVHNIGVAFALAIFYIIFVISLCKKKFASQKNFSFSEKPIFIQVFLMSFMNFSCALIYVYEQHFPTPKLIMQFSQFGWMCIHGLPSVIYLGLNKRIRRRVFNMIGIQNGGNTSTVPLPALTSKTMLDRSTNKYEVA